MQQLKAKEVESAYVKLMTFAQLCIERLPNHPNYRNLKYEKQVKELKELADDNFLQELQMLQDKVIAKVGDERLAEVKEEEALSNQLRRGEEARRLREQAYAVKHAQKVRAKEEEEYQRQLALQSAPPPPPMGDSQELPLNEETVTHNDDQVAREGSPSRKSKKKDLQGPPSPLKRDDIAEFTDDGVVVIQESNKTPLEQSQQGENDDAGTSVTSAQLAPPSNTSKTMEGGTVTQGVQSNMNGEPAVVQDWNENQHGIEHQEMNENQGVYEEQTRNVDTPSFQAYEEKDKHQEDMVYNDVSPMDQSYVTTPLPQNRSSLMRKPSSPASPNLPQPRNLPTTVERTLSLKKPQMKVSSVDPLSTSLAAASIDDEYPPAATWSRSPSSPPSPPASDNVSMSSSRRSSKSSNHRHDDTASTSHFYSPGISVVPSGIRVSGRASRGIKVRTAKPKSIDAEPSYAPSHSEKAMRKSKKQELPPPSSSGAAPEFKQFFYSGEDDMDSYNAGG